MFRRKDSEPGRGGELGHEPSFPRALAEPKLGQPELPRRSIDLQATTQPSLVENPSEGMTVTGTPEKKQLIVGHGISLSGEITACDRLVVLGTVQVTLNQTRAIEIAETGRFTNGKAEVEEAEISGLYEGDLTVRRRLLIRGTGQVKGTVRYGELEIERGGRLEGSVSLLGEKVAEKKPAAEPQRPAAAAA